MTPTALAAGTWDTSTITVKGSAWGWSEVQLYDDGTKGDAAAGDGKYTDVMSQQINQNAPPYPGLLKSGDQPQFIFVFNGVEYKDGSGTANTAGVTAGTKASGASGFTSQTIQITGGTGLGSGNTYITVFWVTTAPRLEGQPGQGASKSHWPASSSTTSSASRTTRSASTGGDPLLI